MIFPHFEDVEQIPLECLSTLIIFRDKFDMICLLMNIHTVCLLMFHDNDYESTVCSNKEVVVGYFEIEASLMPQKPLSFEVE